MRWLADFVYFLAGILYSPLAAYHAIVLGKHRSGWAQRFGRVPRRDPGKKRVWIHAVSLGEINATPKLVEALQRELPDHEFVFSTTTDTGFARGAQLYGADRVFRFPLDFSWVITRALNRIRPTAVVLMELEVWYNLTRTAARRGIPVVVANGRLTDRSARRFGYIAPLVRPMFADLAWVGAQDEPTAARFRAVGVRPDRIGVTSSLKWDTAVVSDRIAGQEALATALGIGSDMPLWVAGSTGPGEEEIILDAYLRLTADSAPPLARNVLPGEVRPKARSVRLAIVPRKPERFDDVARLIEQRGLGCVRRSRHPDGAAQPAEPTPAGDGLVLRARPAGDGVADRGAVILGDTMGELRKFYSLASAVFVGRSLVPMGGSDVMEAAALRKPILVGPHTDNFREAVACLRRADAIRIVETADELAQGVAELVDDSSARRTLGDRAREVVLSNQGATERTVVGIVSTISDPSGSPTPPALENRAAVREHERERTISGEPAPHRR